MKKLLLVILVAIPLISGSQELDYTPLAPIPQITGGGRTVKVSEFVPRAITLGIGIAGALAVIFIMIGGVQYITTDAYGAKGDAKKTIEAAVFGLLLAIGSYAILFTIDKDLVRFDLDIGRVQQGGAIDPNSINTSNGTGSAYDTGCVNNCIMVTQLPIKPPGIACRNDICYLNSDLVEKLRNLDEAMGNTGWQITEAYPPTVTHQDACHMGRGTNAAGSCADIALTDIRIDATSIPIIKKLLDALKAEGLKVDYEVTTAQRFTQLQTSPELYDHRANIKQNVRATAEHAHVEL